MMSFLMCSVAPHRSAQMSPQFKSSIRWILAFVFVAIAIAILSQHYGILQNAVETTLFITLFVLTGSLLRWRLITSSRHTSKISGIIPSRVSDAMDSLTEGLLILDQHERIVLANKAFARMIQSDVDQLHGQSVSTLAWVAGMHDGRSHNPWSGCNKRNWSCAGQLMYFQLPDGQTRTFSANASRSRHFGKRPYGVFVTFRDVTDFERHRAEVTKKLLLLRSSRDQISRKNRELEVLAAQDPLTECLNRRSFMKSFQRSWDIAQRDDRPLACLILDIDHFKQVNDCHGHPIGDLVLKRVAQAIRESVNTSSFVCRYGGEEFCIAIPGATTDQVFLLAEKLRQKIESIQFSDPSELRLTASIGVTSKQSEAADIHDMIHHSDQALYQAKRQGRNRTIVYQPKFNPSEPPPKSTPAETPKPTTSVQDNRLALDQLREINLLLNEISRTAIVRSHD